jgi:hypothetical protein
MELGCDAVLLNTAIAGAKDPIAMAEAMKYGVLAGRVQGRTNPELYATASARWRSDRKLIFYCGNCALHSRCALVNAGCGQRAQRKT